MSIAVEDFMMYRSIAKRIAEVYGIMSENADEIFAEMYNIRERMTEEEVKELRVVLNGDENE